MSTLPVGAGWRRWLSSPPPFGVRLILAREPDRIVWHEPVPWPGVTTREDLDPHTNAAGLLWRTA
jgi:hypothetical protein